MESLGKEVWEEVVDTVWDPISDPAWRSVNDSVAHSTEYEIWQPVWRVVGSLVKERIMRKIHSGG